ncbi:SusC/RagA family TonB-linked outer membrane protein [Echinicola sediminis]
MKKIILLKHWGWLKLAMCAIIIQTLYLPGNQARANGQDEKTIEEVFLTLDQNSYTLSQLILLIEEKTGFTFSYYKNEIDLGGEISPTKKRTSVYDLLVEVSKQQNLSFRQVDKFINIKPRQVADKSGKDAMAIAVRGTVSSADSGESIPGVNVRVLGTNKGTVTDLDGNYTIEVTNGSAVLEFSYIGFENVQVTVGTRTQIDVQLTESSEGLEEVVVVGYGTQKKVNLTGSIAAVKTDDIIDVPLANLSNGLAGRAPGVQVVGTSGLAGASSSIRIRGSDGEPLYVINGVIRSKADFDALNPNEVENISFLKDAASAAIYGSSAGDGVVLVTTKGGNNQKPVFEYRGNYSASESTRPIQGFSAQEEITFLNNAAITRGLPEPYGQEILDYFSDKSYGINDLIWQTPTVQEHNLSVRGGTEDVNYYVQMGYHTEEGSYKNLGYDRYNFRSDISAKITESLKMSLNLSGNQRNYNRWYWPYDGAEDFNVGDFYRATFNWTRLYPFYVDEAGNPTNNPSDFPVKPAGGWHPPHLMLNEGGYRDTRYRTFDGILKLDLDLGQYVKGLSTSVQGNINAYDRNMKSFVIHNKYYIFQSGSTTNKFVPGPVDLSQTGSHNLSSGYENIQENITLSNAYQLNWYLNYNRTFGQHEISALAVYEQAGSNSKNINGRAESLLSTSIDQIYNTSSDTERRWFSGSEGEFARASWIGRANYSFAQKYIAEFSFRYDGNYKFAPGKQWGFFPSGSMAWRISEEPFIKDLSLFDDLKLRASYGTTGSDSGINAWRWGQVYQKTTGYVFGSSLSDGLEPGAVPNPDITWSTISMWDIGLEFGFLNNRLVGEMDIWGKTESDILGTRLGTTPTTYGASLPAVNYGQRSWKGFEINMDWRDRIGELKYSVYGNLGFAKDQWDLWDEPESYTDGTYEGNWRSRIGRPDNRVSGYISKGIIRTQEQLDALPEGFTQFGREPMLGTILFEDIRGANYSEGPDGKIDGNDVTYLSDNGTPRINYGVGFRGEWKGFSLNAHFQGVGAYDRMVSTRNGGGVFQVGDRPYFDIWARDYWTPENPNAPYPRVNGQWMQPEFGGGASSFWMRNGAYLRLKNLNLGYSLPQRWFDGLGINKVQVYGNATNLFVITDLKEHDPEQATLDSYPLMKTFTGGLTVQF